VLKSREGSKHVKLKLPDKGTIVKAMGGGTPCMLIVFVVTQPSPSTTVIVVIPIGRLVAMSEFPETLPGVGLQVIDIGTDAEPAVVSVTEETGLEQPDWVIEALTMALEV
jgi:hypothetical protein